jgi:hypothetical protein
LIAARTSAEGAVWATGVSTSDAYYRSDVAGAIAGLLVVGRLLGNEWEIAWRPFSDVLGPAEQL